MRLVSQMRSVWEGRSGEPELSSRRRTLMNGDDAGSISVNSTFKRGASRSVHSQIRSSSPGPSVCGLAAKISLQVVIETSISYSPSDYMLCYPQDDTCRLLVQ